MSQIFRLYEPVLFKKDTSLTFSGESHHIVARVLRMKNGDRVELINGLGQIAAAKLTDVNKKTIEVEIESIKQFEPPLPSIRLYVGCLKGEKLSFVTQKIAELGVSEIGFFISDHSVAMKSENFLQKTNKTLIEALRQSGNPFMPHSSFFNKLSEIDSTTTADHWNIVLDETHDVHFPELLKLERPKSVSLFVGPEGGFSAAERDYFREKNHTFIRIAPYILRADTAAVAAVSLIRAAFA